VNKIILIDDHYHHGWEDVFGAVIKQIYGERIQFECLHEITNDNITACYESNPNALFIQDNDLGPNVISGVDWIKKYYDTRTIIFHTADVSYEPSFQAAVSRVPYYMTKDDPNNPKSDDEMRHMIIGFHKCIIHHFKLLPEFMWLVYKQLCMISPQ